MSLSLFMISNHLSLNKPKRSAGGSLQGLGAMLFIVAGILFIAGGPLKAHAAVYEQLLDDALTPGANASDVYVRVLTITNDSQTLNAIQLQAPLWDPEVEYSISVRNDNVGLLCTSDTVIGLTSGIATFPFTGCTLSGPNSGSGYWPDFYLNASADPTPNKPALVGTEESQSDGLISGGSGCCGSLTSLWFRVYTASDEPPPPEPTDTRTRIVSFTPEDASTLPSGVPVDFDLHIYINPDDVGTFLKVYVSYLNLDQNVLLLGNFSPYTIAFLTDFTATTSGDFFFSTSTLIADGNYRVQASIQRGYLGILKNPFSDISDTQNHQYVVGEGTFIGTIAQSSFSQLSSIFASSSATSTAALARTCIPLGDFDIISCLAFMFVPDFTYVSATLDNFKNTAATHFPLGYITDFIGIVSTTSTSSLTVVDATLPNGVAGVGASIHLDLSHVLDPILYATTSLFTNASAPDTRTFFEITSYYWNILVVVGALFYMLRRVIGSHLFGTAHPFQEMSGDRDVSDEAYRLKETLYNMQNRK